MALHDYWTKQVHFEKLKNIQNCTISFDKNLVGILGINGSGKSTILHALACMYKPVAGATNYKFSYFFTPNTHSRWNDSKMTLIDTYKENGVEHERTVVFEKQSRWTPHYDRRLERHVSFIGIKSCVPIIEIESQEGRINFQTTTLDDDNSRTIKTIASYVLQRNYEEYNLNQTPHRKYTGVRHQGITYSSLSMGAGEQRIFTIIEQLVKAPVSSMILIDEIDLLLHRDALRRLLEKTNEIAERKKMQIVFTTHNHSILRLDFIQFRHLYQADDRTFCLDDANPDVMYRLTGEQKQPISVYVEDDLSKALIKQIAAQLQIQKSVKVEIYGAATNCFTCASAITLMNLERNGTFFVLDGDCYRTEEAKRRQLNKFFSGNEPNIEERKNRTLQFIHQFIIPDMAKPERYYHSCITNTPDERLRGETLEYQRVAKEIIVVDDDHEYLSDIIARMGESREIGLKTIVQILAESDDWGSITSEVRSVLERKKIEFHL